MESAVFFLIFSLGVVKGADWSYHDGPGGPDSWGIDYPFCNGDQQSPIDINTASAHHDANLMPFMFHGYNTEIRDTSISNNGHSAVVTINSNEAKISAGGLNWDTYQLAQFHFHWGADLWHGSEHTMDGKAYPAEIHLVHFNTKYGDLATAVDKPDGLAVLGVFLEDGEHNMNYDPIINGLNNVIHKDESHDLPPFYLMSLLPQDVSTYYRYKGSLTTPGCFESVTWTVFKNTVKLSQEQLSVFRTLVENVHGEEDVPMVNNYRPVQSMAGRNLWVSTPPKPPTSTSNMILGNTFLLLGIMLCFIFNL